MAVSLSRNRVFARGSGPAPVRPLAAGDLTLRDRPATKTANRPPGAEGTARLNGLPDAELLDQVRRRDETALAALYDRYGGLVFTVALRVLGDRDLAEEAMQDAFLRCWRGIETYHPERGHAAAWLMGIARNRAVDLLRSRQHQARLRERTSLPEPDAPGEPQVGDAADVVVTGQAVAAALGALPPAQRRVVELAYYGGLTQVEIAQALGEPLGTVKTRTRSALERLREMLRPSFRPEAAAERDPGGRRDA